LSSVFDQSGGSKIVDKHDMLDTAIIQTGNCQHELHSLHLCSTVRHTTLLVPATITGRLTEETSDQGSCAKIEKISIVFFAEPSLDSSAKHYAEKQTHKTSFIVHRTSRHGSSITYKTLTHRARTTQFEILTLNFMSQDSHEPPNLVFVPFVPYIPAFLPHFPYPLH